MVLCRLLVARQFIIEGRKSAIDGTPANRISRKISATQKGVTPLKMVVTGTSFSTPFRTNTLSPMGGVIRLI